MATPRQERADAVRNRQAVLRAAERLLAAAETEAASANAPGATARRGTGTGTRTAKAPTTGTGIAHISLDQVAREAGVGKGTLFRRFGSRTGLFTALLAERAAEIAESIAEGPPPLGPGAPPAARLSAFLDALAELAVRNVALLAAHEQACSDGKFTDPTYVRWHTHVTALLTEARPDGGLDASATAHFLLGAFDGELVRLLAPDGSPQRLAAAVGALAAAASQPSPDPAGHPAAPTARA